MKPRELIAYLIVVPLAALLLFLPEKGEKKGSITNFHQADFFTLLGKETSSWRYVSPHHLVQVQKFSKLFEKNRTLEKSPPPVLKIPTIIHVIWLGPHAFPRESVENMRTWVAHHPDWTVKFWTDRERPAPVASMQVHSIAGVLPPSLQKLYDQSDNWAEKADILRYVLLWKEGGVYVDHDANCVEGFHLLHRAYDMYSCFEMPHAPVDGRSITVGIGIIGARPHHPVIKGAMEYIEANWDRFAERYADQDPQTKRDLVLHRTYLALTVSLEQHADQNGNSDIVFPASYFYAKEGLPTLYSKHFYGGTWEEIPGSQALDQKIGTKIQTIAKDIKKLYRWEGFSVVLLVLCLLLGFRLFLPRSLAICLLFGLCTTLHGVENEEEFSIFMGQGREEFQYIQTPEDILLFDGYKRVYEFQQKQPYSVERRIPLIIHFFWFGSQAIPEEVQRNMQRWVEIHPTWTFFLWTDRPREAPHPLIQHKEINTLTPKLLAKEISSARSLKEKIDLCRYEVLYHFGGVVVHHDVTPERSFELFHCKFDCYAGLLPLDRSLMSSSIHVSHTIIGAKAHHPIIYDTICRIQQTKPSVEIWFPSHDEDSEIMRYLYTVSIPFNDAIRKGVRGEDRTIIFPAGYFFSLENDFGIYARHLRKVSSFDGKTSFERRLEQRLSQIERKTTDVYTIMFGIALLSALLCALVLYLYHWNRVHGKAIRSQ